MHTFDRPAQRRSSWIVQDRHLVGTDEESRPTVGIALPIQAESLSGEMHGTACNRDRE